MSTRYQNAIGTRLCELMERTGFGVPILCGYALRAAGPRRLREWLDWADVVLVEFPWQFDCCRSMSGGKPMVLSTHNAQAAKAGSGGDNGAMGSMWIAWTEALERRLRGSDLVLAVSCEDRDELARRYGVAPRKISVIPNGADIHLYCPADEVTRAALRRRLNLPAGPTVIFPAPHRQTPILEGMKWVRRVAKLVPGGYVSDHRRRGRGS